MVTQHSHGSRPMVTQHSHGSRPMVTQHSWSGTDRRSRGNATWWHHLFGAFEVWDCGNVSFFSFFLTVYLSPSDRWAHCLEVEWHPHIWCVYQWAKAVSEIWLVKSHVFISGQRQAVRSDWSNLMCLSVGKAGSEIWLVSEIWSDLLCRIGYLVFSI